MPRTVWLLASGWLLVAAATAHAADDVTLNARVDKIRAAVGEPVALTLSVEAEELQGIAVPPLKLPAQWSAVAQSQSQQVTWRQGQTHRRLELTYVLVPHAPGDVSLGPFTVERKGKRWQADALTIHVEGAPQPTPPPTLKHPPGERVTL